MNRMNPDLIITVTVVLLENRLAFFELLLPEKWNKLLLNGSKGELTVLFLPPVAFWEQGFLFVLLL